MSLATACDVISSDQLPVTELLFCDNGLCKESISFVFSDDERGWNSSPSANNPDVGVGNNVDGNDNGCGGGSWC